MVIVNGQPEENPYATGYDLLYLDLLDTETASSQ